LLRISKNAKNVYEQLQQNVVTEYYIEANVLNYKS
jgi:hypothetical protein